MGSGDDLVCTTQSRSARPLLEHREKAPMPYRKVIEGKMRGQEMPRMSEKYHRKQASEWNKVEKAFHQCIAGLMLQRDLLPETFND